MSAPATTGDAYDPIPAGEEVVELRGPVGSCWYWLCSCGEEGPFQVSRIEALWRAYDHADTHLTPVEVDAHRPALTRVRYVWGASDQGPN